MLERLSNGLPTILNQLRRIGGLDAFIDHLIEAKQRAGLQHAAENRLLAHKI